MNREEQITSMAAFVREMAEKIVDNPEAINVVPMRVPDGKVVLSITADKSDLGKLIGKQGRTARAMRIILNAASATAGVGYELTIPAAIEA